MTNCVTTTDRCTGSGMRSRRGAGPLRGIQSVLAPYPRVRAVLAACLAAAGDATRVERAAHNLVANTRKVADPATAHEHDRVLLEVVADARDVGGHFDAGGEAHTGDLAQRRVGLLRGVGEHTRADSTALGRSPERRRLRLLTAAGASLADELLDGGQTGSSDCASVERLHVEGQRTGQREGDCTRPTNQDSGSKRPRCK